MKNISFFLIAFITVNVFAQPRGGGGGGRQQGRNSQFDETQEVKKFSASDAAGVFYYDIEKVIKKIKVKDEKKQYQIKKALRNYNSKISEISFLNSDKFEELDIAINSLPKRSRQSRNQFSEDDSENKNDIRKKTGLIIRPVKDEIRENERELNRVLEEILSKKQQKKWLKFQKKKKESLQPQKREGRDNQNFRPTGGGGQRGGMR
jgi:hypothetical protein